MSRDDSANPYAPSEIYEPARRRGLFPQPLVAQGRLDFHERQRGMQLAAGVTTKDWVMYALRIAIPLAVAMYLAGSGETLVVLPILGCVILLQIAMKLSWQRWAKRSARRAQKEHGNRLVERRIDDAGVWALVDGTPQLTSWSSYGQARLHDERIVLVIGDYQACQTFPRSHFATNADWALFRKAVKKYIRAARDA